MEGRGAYLRVGLLVAFGIVALLGLLSFFAGPRVREGANFETYFRESVQGLDNGAQVKFRGVALGQVTSIGLVSAAYGGDTAEANTRSAYALVYVRFRVDLSRVGSGKVPIEAVIRNGLRARLASQGLTGVSYVELDFVAPEAYPPLAVPWKPLDTYVPSIPSTLTEVQDSAVSLLDQLNHIDLVRFVNAATGLLSDLRQELKTGELHQTLEQTTQTMQALNAALVSADLPGLTADLRHALAGVNNATDGPQTRQLIAGANAAVTRLATAVAQLPPLVASLQQTARQARDGTADVQAGLAPLLRDLQTALGNLRDTSTQLRSDPGQLLWGGPPPRDGGAAR